MNKVYIYIKKEEEIGEIIEKLRKTKEKEIILVIPDQTKAFLHPINLEILKNEIENSDKKIYFDTEDEKILNLLRNKNFNIFLSESKEPIMDIKPPREKKVVVDKVDKVDKKTKPTKKIEFSKIFINIFKYSLTLSFVFILSFFLWQLFQAKAEISIETSKVPYELNEVLTFQKDALKPDEENKILPAEYIKTELVRTETITTTGKIFTEEKPLLKVIFFNYLDREIPLVNNTRLSFDDNIFLTTERIIIPAKNTEPGQKETEAIPVTIKNQDLYIPEGNYLKILALEGKKTNGVLWSDVLKVKVKENYNLTVKSVGSVSPDDLTNIKLKLENSLKALIASELALKYGSNFYYFDPSLVNIQIQDISHKIGEKTDKISATGKASYETLIVSKKELDDFIRNLINKDILNQGKKMMIGNLNYEKVEILDFDPNKKIMKISLNVKANLMPDINLESLKEEIKGKNLKEVANFFNKAGILKVNIKITPQWKENLPNDSKRIKIEIK